ncbi:hypothetical protein [Pseudolysinimonas sp.]
MTRTHALGALALTVALGISGCSLLPGGDGGELTYEDSPLSAYLDGGMGDLSEEEMNQRFTEQQTRVEELVAACMSDEGFEYIPVDQTQSGGYSFSGDEWDPESRDWVEQYGYGAVDWPGRDIQPDPEDIPVDPNQDYVASLSESERNAYYEVLYGPQPTEEELGEDGSYEYDPDNAGCYGSAQQEVQGADPWSAEEFKPVTDAINTFYQDVQNAPALADLNRAWSACMTEAGFSGFATQPDAQNSIYDEINAFYEARPEGAEQDDPEFLAIGEKEIELALADLDCREQTDYRQQSLKLQFELEEKFIQDNQAELDALKAALEQRAS